MSLLDTKPSSEEFPSYAALYVNTAGAVLESTRSGLLDILGGQVDALTALVAGVDDATAQRGYAPGKWTLAESLIHVADTERVFAYRVMRVARGDKTPLPGFEQDAWVPETRAARRTMADILTEVAAVRAASLALINSLDEPAILQTGTASGGPVTVRGLVWMIAGHFAHHLDITRTRYLGGG